MLKKSGSRPPSERRIALTADQQKRFLNFVVHNRTYSHWTPLMVTLLGTGMRIAECLGLTWDDIDLEQNTISVNHNLSYCVVNGKAGFHITPTKTHSSIRIIPIIFPEVGQYLKALYDVKDIAYLTPSPVLDGYGDFVFRDRYGQLFKVSDLNRAIASIVKEYNLSESDHAKTGNRKPEPLPRFNAHNLRHTFYIRLREVTSDVTFIRSIMGYTGFSVTTDICSQESLQKKITAIAGQISLL